MTTEDTEMLSGWPLGLEIMNMRIRVRESSQAAEPTTLNLPSPSFSSFSTSNLDTESTASFFQDHSVSLGRLIGIRPSDGSLYFPSRVNQREIITSRAVKSEFSRERGADMSHGICIPLLLSTMEKINGSKNKSRR